MAEIHLWHWIAFAVLLAVLLTLDLAVFHRRDRTPSWRESVVVTLAWCSLAAAFNVFFWWWRGNEAGIQFLTGYLVEWSLSMDNVFVFAVIFGYFQVPPQYQYPVLFWGILGAVVLRLLFILAGTTLLQRLDWVLPMLGLFLVYTAYRLAGIGAARSIRAERGPAGGPALAPRVRRRSRRDRPAVLRPAKRPPAHHAAAAGPAGDRNHRSALRGR